MNIVITGASGFIGEAICKKFIAINNINVLAVNRSSSNNLRDMHKKNYTAFHLLIVIHGV